jgi:hypothetical protein
LQEKPESWSDKGTEQAQEFIKFVYPLIMGVHQAEDPVDSNGNLKTNERERLNTRISRDAKGLRANYHAILSKGDEWQFMRNEKVLVEVQKLLPAFNFYLKQSGRLDSQNFFSEDELSLEYAFTHFFETVLGDA